MEIKYNKGEIIETKAADNGRMQIKAYAAVFGNVDSYGDVIEVGAFKNWLSSEDASRCALCYQHRQTDVIGVIKSMQEDNIGLLIEAEILPTTLGNDVQELMRAGAIKEFSIGYYTRDYKYVTRNFNGYDQDVRLLTEIAVIEISPVTRAANPRAVLVDAKSDMAELSDTELVALKERIDKEYTKRVLTQI